MADVVVSTILLDFAVCVCVFGAGADSGVHQAPGPAAGYGPHLRHGPETHPADTHLNDREPEHGRVGRLWFLGGQAVVPGMPFPD